MTYRLDPVCHPTKGDSIVGIRENNEIVIHRRNCVELKKYIADPDLWYSVEWNSLEQKHSHNMMPVCLIILWKTQPESMGAVVEVLSKLKVEIESFSILTQEHKKTKVQANIRVKNENHLLDVLDALRVHPKVLSVYQSEEGQ